MAGLDRTGGYDGSASPLFTTVMPQVLRVVLDTNVFSPSHFDSLRNSPFRGLCARGRVQPIYPGVMIEEVLQSYGSPLARPQLLADWIPMILDTAPRLCDDLVSIFRKELVQGRGPNAMIFMPAPKERQVRDQLTSIPADGSWDLMDATRLEREDAQRKRVARRETSKDMRQVVARQARQRGLKIVPGSIPATFTPGKEDLVELMAKALLQKFVSPNGWQSLFAAWRRRKGHYPFFTQFAQDVVFQEVHFMTDHASGIDINAQADLEILMHLLRADAIVSNETGFLKEAFSANWRQKGKVLFTSNEFGEHLRKLV